MSNLVILDRDGVINHDSDEYIKSVDEWIPIDGSLEAIARLKRAGYRIAVASNQSGLARGYFDEATLQAMHAKMQALLQQRGASVDGIYFCPHGPDNGCTCRKPRPGMLLQIARDFSIDLRDTWFVGDSNSDIMAARTAGARPALVRTGKGERTLEHYGPFENLPVYANLSQFVRDFLAHAFE